MMKKFQRIVNQKIGEKRAFTQKVKWIFHHLTRRGWAVLLPLRRSKRDAVRTTAVPLVPCTDRNPTQLQILGLLDPELQMTDSIENPCRLEKVSFV